MDFAHLRDDGTTTSGNWLYVGQWTEKAIKLLIAIIQIHRV